MLERGLAKAPGDRWPSSGEFVDALERTLAGQATETKPTRRLRGTAATAVRTPDAAPRRRGGAPLLIGLAALALLAVIGAIALAARDGGGEETPRAESTPTAEATETATEAPTEAPTEEPTQEPTQTATAEPTQTATEAPPSGEPELDAARRLQLEGYNARRAGDFETALAKAREAQQACGNSRELSPCGYALYEEGVALVALGQPEAAIPILERRLAEYGDNNNKEVEKALRDARREARKAD